MSENLLEEYISASLMIERVEMDETKLTVFWSDGRMEEFPLSSLKKVAIITTDRGPFEPDVFWWLLMEIPVMIPDDPMVPGSEQVKDILFKLPGFNFESFIKAMTSTDKDAFELWENEEK
jgi:hypothetical protein